MRMFKNTIFIALLLFLISCGYEAKYSKKNIIKESNFSIGEVNYSGDREVNIKIKEKLNSFTLIKKERHFTIDINSIVLKTTIVKDAKGNPSAFNLNIKSLIQLRGGNIDDSKILLIENFKYDNNQDKFEVKRYEREIKQNLAEKISDDLIDK